MTPLQSMVARHEGYRQNIYKDTTGNLTIGYGTNLTAGLSPDRSAALMAYDIEQVRNELTHRLPCFNGLSVGRQNVLIDMGYNMGVPVLMKFAKMLDAVDRGQWDRAANEMLDSTWAHQVSNRAIELADIMRSGVMEI